MSTTLFNPAAGQQGAADGIGTNLANGVLPGTYGFADAEAAYALKILVEQTRAPNVVAWEADAVPRVAGGTVLPLEVGAASDVMLTNRGTASVPVNVDPVSAGSPRGRAAVGVPLELEAQAAATGRVTAAVLAPLEVGATSTAVPRIVAAVLYPLRLAASSSVVATVTGVVLAALRFVPGIRGRVGGYTRVRAEDRSGPAISVRDESEGRPYE